MRRGINASCRCCAKRSARRSGRKCKRRGYASVCVADLVLLRLRPVPRAAQPSTSNRSATALMTVDREWSQTTKEPEKFVSYFADGASIYAPGMPMVTGGEAIRKIFTEMSKAPGFALSWTATKAEVSASGDIGYTAGTYEMTMGAVSEKGKYVTVWKKQGDGRGRSPRTSSMPTRLRKHQPATTRWSPRTHSSGAIPPPGLPAGARVAVVAGNPADGHRTSFVPSFRRTTGSHHTRIRPRKT